MMREIIAAVRQAIPDASSEPPGAVLQHVLSALRQAEAKTINSSEMIDLQTVADQPKLKPFHPEWRPCPCHDSNTRRNRQAPQRNLRAEANEMR